MAETSFRPPVTLRGRWVELVPLSAEHAAGLVAAGQGPGVWTYHSLGPARDAASMLALIEELLRRQASGSDLAFTVIARWSGRPVGMTRYLDIVRADRRVEIGGTWYDQKLWRTPVNTEAKLLLLRQAFDREAFHRVQIKTDLRNERSQRAIERLGAVREGVLRDAMRLHDGYLRSSVYYSILEDEWPDTRRRLEAQLERPWTPPTTE